MSTDTKTAPEFTPTESLIIDVLVARYRLGDTLWTFESRNMPALRKLEEKDLIETISGVTEKTIRVSLSDRALRDHGTSWFQLGVTMDHLPDDNSVAEGAWSKRNLEQLVELPQQQSATDPRAINAAHVLLILMISRRHPLHQVLPGTDGGVVLKRDDHPGDADATSVRISPDGKNFELCRGNSVDSTSHLGTALFFTSRWSR
jgi:hypothetical protein